MQHEKHSFTLQTHAIKPLTWSGGTSFIDEHRAMEGKKAVVIAGTGHREKDFPMIGLTIFTRMVSATAIERHLESNNGKTAQHDPMWVWNQLIGDAVVDKIAAELTKNDVTLVKTGMALGWDMLLACAAIKAGIPFVAYLPYESQAARWPKVQKKLWMSVVAQAAAVVLVTPDQDITGIDGELSEDGVRNVLFKRNFALVHNMTGKNDYVFSFDKGKNSGGTRHCVKIAQSLNLKIVNFWDMFETWVALPDVATLQLQNLGKVPKYRDVNGFYEMDMVPVDNNMGAGFRAEMDRIKDFWYGNEPEKAVIPEPTPLEVAVSQLGF